MTPKEKARQIICKYDSVDIQPFSEFGDYMIDEAVKQCAVIAVDEILNALADNRISYGGEYRYEVSDFYQQVKQEIEAL